LPRWFTRGCHVRSGRRRGSAIFQNLLRKQINIVPKPACRWFTFSTTGYKAASGNSYPVAGVGAADKQMIQALTKEEQVIIGFAQNGFRFFCVKEN